MPIVFQVRNRLFEEYSTTSRKIQWVQVKRTGTKFQDVESGVETELFRIKVFAEAIDRTVPVVKEWEKRGLIPPPLFVPAGDQCTHWYSAQQIINAHRIMIGKYQGRKYIRDGELFKQFMNDIRGIWYARDIVVGTDGHRKDANT